VRHPARIIGGLIAAAAAMFAASAGAQEAKHYRFAYDQPRNTGYSIAGDLFADKLKELSKGTMLIDQYPGAQLGQEPQLLQLVKSVQTGVVDAAENSINVYLVNKHYEVAPVLSITEHEANNALVLVSDKLWQSLSAEQKQWVLTSAAEISAKEPTKAFELEKTAAAKLKTLGVKIVDDVDKKSFIAIADPYLDKLAKELGPHADKIKTLIRAIN
jgi:TRAP-type C4-dicarboxylate transport system substrate-binding protein